MRAIRRAHSEEVVRARDAADDSGWAGMDRVLDETGPAADRLQETAGSPTCASRVGGSSDSVCASRVAARAQAVTAVRTSGVWGEDTVIALAVYARRRPRAEARAVYLRPGQTVRLGIDGLGEQRQTMVAAP